MNSEDHNKTAWMSRLTMVCPAGKKTNMTAKTNVMASSRQKVNAPI